MVGGIRGVCGRFQSSASQPAGLSATRVLAAAVPETLEAMIAVNQEQHHSLAERLNHLDDATWNPPAWLIRGEQEIILRDSIGGLLWIALFDAVHNRGQLSKYIRPMGGKVPIIYCPSCDAPARQ